MNLKMTNVTRLGEFRSGVFTFNDFWLNKYKGTTGKDTQENGCLRGTGYQPEKLFRGTSTCKASLTMDDR